jgi:hypothetical protein
MTRVVIVGELYNADLTVGGGPILPGAPPPGIWPSPGHPAHPIAPGGRPPGIWGGAPPYPDQGLPGQPPGYWGGVAPPTAGHPIAPGGRPPGIWGGPPLYPDQGLPGAPPGIWPSPGYPTHPIAPGGPPPGFWGGVSPPTAGHPIVPPTDTVWVIGYAEGYGPTWVKVQPAPEEPPPEATEPNPAS